jgi:flagellar biosynthesis protein FlhG
MTTGRTTGHFVRVLADRLGLEEDQISKVVKALFEVIHDELRDEGKVEVRQLGTFAVVQRPDRTRLLPDGKEVRLPPSRAIGFRAAGRLARRIEVAPEIRNLLQKKATSPAEQAPSVQGPAAKGAGPAGRDVRRARLAQVLFDGETRPGAESALNGHGRKAPPPPRPRSPSAPESPSAPVTHARREPSTAAEPRSAPPSLSRGPVAPPEPLDLDDSQADPVSLGARVLCVASGKGGTGKSFTVCNLAVQLAMEGQRVILLDADLGLANLHLLLGINPRFNLSHVLGGELSLADIAEEGPCGIKLISGGSGVVKLANLREHEVLRFARELAGLEAHADLIIIDTAAGLSPRTIAFLAASQEILLVTTPDITAMTDAYAVLKSIEHLGREGQTISLVVNQAANGTEARAVYERLSGVARKFLGKELADLGYILDDPTVGRAVASRTPVVLLDPSCRASQGIGRLAVRLREMQKPRAAAGYAERLTGILVDQVS